MPLYNVGPFLREAMDSLLNQSFTDFEVLAIDDCSTDDTVAVLQTYDDPRIKLIRKEQNSGIVGAMNLGLESVQAPYVVRMDGDDLSTPDRFQKLYDFMESHPEIGVCSSAIQRFGADNEVWRYQKDPILNRASLIFEHRIGHAASILRSELFFKHGVRYRDDYPYMEDYHLFTELRDLTLCTTLEEPLYHYRILQHNSTVQNQHTAVARKKAFYGMVLRELGFEANEQEVDQHYALGVSRLEGHTPSQLWEWRKRLEAANQNKAVYPTEALSQVFDAKWKAMFFRIVDNTPEHVKEYASLGSGLSPEQKKYWRRLRFNRLIGRA